MVDDLLSTSGRRGAGAWVTSEDTKSFGECFDLISSSVKADHRLALIDSARVNE